MKKILLFLFTVIINMHVFSQEIIQMEKKNNVYFLPCVVNGLNLKFILDTGASNVSISLTEAIFMLKNGYLDEDDILDKEKYQIANGQIEEGTKIIINKIIIGRYTLENITASVSHHLNAPLLLGQNVLEKFGELKIDYTNNRLTYWK
jgi:clan AA aspartic protease (TIGR02281 family)